MKVIIYVGEKNEFLQNKINSLMSEFENLEIDFLDEKDKKDYSETDVFLGISMTREELEKANKLKQIFVPYTGLNNFPQDELLQREINIEGTHVKAKYVAEKALSLLLATMGKVVIYDSEMRKGSWDLENRRKWESLFDRKVGLVGVGHIGQEFIKLVSGFTTNFSTIDRGKKIENISNYYSSFKELAKNTEVLIVSLPLNSSTKNIIDREVLENFNGYIVNVGRGKVIEEEAFYSLLKSNQIKGAGIDVWYNYPSTGAPCSPSKYPFHELSNMVMSPHVGTDNQENKWSYFNDTFSKLRKYIHENID
ncbi:MAG: NAD(P)-dependent oxidoreductase [Psychrilyobacter sp.]|uniref:NAD(P)-dependent oxidoreductase n=1 Tax=Psychrilyobacter sp. TaxID=2586924 RepID=UPI003C721C1C